MTGKSGRGRRCTGRERKGRRQKTNTKEFRCAALSVFKQKTSLGGPPWTMGTSRQETGFRRAAFGTFSQDSGQVDSPRRALAADKICVVGLKTVQSRDQLVRLGIFEPVSEHK